MDRFRLKNVIILILLLLNGFLAGSLTLQSTAEQSARQSSAEELSALFALDGIALEPSAAMGEAASSGWTVSRSDSLEQEAAAFLLGADVSRSLPEGGVSTYTAAAGTALFYADGSFEAAGRLSDDAKTFCASFCKQFGYDAPAFVLDEDGSGSAAAFRVLHGVSVYNGGVAFTIRGGAVTALSGILLPAPLADATLTETPISALAALTIFQQTRRVTGAVVSRITGTAFCYELQTASGASMRLLPAWQILTDTSVYYVNAINGDVSLA